MVSPPAIPASGRDFWLTFPIDEAAGTVEEFSVLIASVPAFGVAPGSVEVHDEAEQLEHVVSDRLIERMDEMLGRPTHDPHGDPIPDADGAVASGHHDSLLTCPLETPLRVKRVADQDPAFLRFIESNGLKPGEAIEVESRDSAADAVRLRKPKRAPLTIGMRAASKLLVEVA